jgi:hypothetical protein
MTKRNENGSKANNINHTSSSTHDTGIYTLRNGNIAFNGDFKNIYRHPAKILFSYDGQLCRDNILQLLSMHDAVIDEFAVYPVTVDGKAEIPNYFIYEVFNS